LMGHLACFFLMKWRVIKWENCAQDLTNY
jgi:hypothetical protein